MTKFTQGNWHVSQPHGTGAADSVKKYRGKPYQEFCQVLSLNPSVRDVKGVAHVYQGDGEVGSPEALAEQAANARLIAAAPDMYAALEWVARNPKANHENIAIIARAALAKANGQ